ncbi:hypothetical protein [Xanthomarina sp.]|uniref:hypothetical protein n=1 Tax=Xanthomarina sp. TaxID=1931211 RepID=UPI002B9F6E76|nr:hypothetical protein [Xanthomarina sp.]HLV38111.1 hypothetical protein [Xanthomarina sp.]
MDGTNGEQGTQGEHGIDGNANVKKYTLTIEAADWNNAVHGGNDNVYHYYAVPSSLTGDIDIFNSGYLVLAYGKPLGFDYSQTKLLPYTFGMGASYGIKFEMDINRNRILMFKTTNGWDSNSLSLAEMPSSFIVNIFMIEVNASNRVINDIDINNYEEVVKYFEIN